MLPRCRSLHACKLCTLHTHVNWFQTRIRTLDECGHAACTRHLHRNRNEKEREGERRGKGEGERGRERERKVKSAHRFKHEFIISMVFYAVLTSCARLVYFHLLVSMLLSNIRACDSFCYCCFCLSCSRHHSPYTLYTQLVRTTTMPTTT